MKLEGEKDVAEQKTAGNTIPGKGHRSPERILSETDQTRSPEGPLLCNQSDRCQQSTRYGQRVAGPHICDTPNFFGRVVSSKDCQPKYPDGFERKGNQRNHSLGGFGIGQQVGAKGNQGNK